MRGLAGKRVLVTGGSSGIGEAIVERLLRERARVHLCGLEPDQVDQVLREMRGLGTVTGTACDVSQPDQVDRLLAAATGELGGLDVLVNNAGIAWEEPFLDLRLDSWRRVLDVNLTGAFMVAQRAAQVMVAQGGGGVVVNMASKNGLMGEENYAHYNASKGGLVLLTRTMALELGPLGIRVNAVCPGYISTPLSRSIDDPEFVARFVERNIPLGRTGDVDEIAAVFAFLASDECPFLHGETIVVDGGQLAQ